MKRRVNLFRAGALAALIYASVMMAKALPHINFLLWAIIIVVTIGVLVATFINLRKRVNLFGFRWSWAEIVGLSVGILGGTLLVWNLFANLEYTYFLASLAIVVAAVAGVGTLLSLKWTRDTVRPFLSITAREFILHEEGDWGFIKLTMRNLGSLPAEEVSIDISSFMSEREGESEKLFDTQRLFDALVIFPNQEGEIMYTVTPVLFPEFVRKGAKLHVKIKYKSIHKECETLRAIRIIWDYELNSFIFPPITKEEYWY